MDKDASTIRQEIEQTRERMGDTVEALAYKTDVPARVRDNVNDRVDAVKGTIGNVVDSVKTAVVGASDTVGSRMNEASNSLGESSHGGVETLRKKGDNISATLTKAGGDLGDRLQRVNVGDNTRRAVGAVQENPIGLGLAALAIGFLTGSLIPVSDAERKRVGPLRGKLVDQAQAATNDLVQAGKAVIADTVSSAMSTARTSAQTHGSDVIDAAKNRGAQT